MYCQSITWNSFFLRITVRTLFLNRYIAGREETWPWLSWILDDFAASLFVMVTGFTSEVAVDKKVLSNHREKLSLTLLCIFDTILEMTLVTWHKTEIHVITHGSLPQQRSQISARLSWTSNSLKERQAIFKLPVKSNAPITLSPSNDAKHPRFSGTTMHETRAFIDDSCSGNRFWGGQIDSRARCFQ